MGTRRKMMYREGRLLDLHRRGVIRSWDVAQERIDPVEMAVGITTRSGGRVIIVSDEHGVWIEEGGQRAVISQCQVNLPRFEGHPHAAALRVLTQETLLNIIDGRPVPHFLTYKNPWHRDAAMTCMVLKATGNLHLVENWIKSLRDPFDRNNAGIAEPDNLGQMLYMVSLVSDATHPAVNATLHAIGKYRRDKHIVGQSDFAEHPVYQTKWLKFGLRSLGLDDPYEIPQVYDSYSALFWMDFRDQHVAGPTIGKDSLDRYPYLYWAEAHFHDWPVPPLEKTQRYPLTFEAHASEADYSAMSAICPDMAAQKISTPHAWHAAEMFLYLFEQR